MPNLKDLKTRIGSVKSTQKTTKAMQMVSASKLRRAKERADAAGPYATHMEHMVTTLAANTSPENAPALLTGNGKSEIHLLVLISSDRGLCGGFNTNLVKRLKQEINVLEADGKQVKIYCIGKKGYEQLRMTHNNYIVGKVEGISKKKVITFDDAREQAEHITTMFDNGEFDICSIFYNEFISAIAQKPKKQQIIPLDTSDEEEVKSDSVYEFEPSEHAILEELLPKNVNMQCYRAILESSASEHAARMTAMDNATRNASDMIGKLTLVYNRSRQAAITKELIEIISGAEAI